MNYISRNSKMVIVILCALFVLSTIIGIILCSRSFQTGLKYTCKETIGGYSTKEAMTFYKTGTLKIAREANGEKYIMFSEYGIFYVNNEWSLSDVSGNELQTPSPFVIEYGNSTYTCVGGLILTIFLFVVAITSATATIVLFKKSRKKKKS